MNKIFSQRIELLKFYKEVISYQS